MVGNYRIFADVLAKRGKYTEENRRVLEHLLALQRMHPLYKPYLKETYGRLSRFHHHVTGTLPWGFARDREVTIWHNYQTEYKKLPEWVPPRVGEVLR